jgi:hypothetical protein
MMMVMILASVKYLLRKYHVHTYINKQTLSKRVMIIFNLSFEKIIT